jgi:hypothetical protein
VARRFGALPTSGRSSTHLNQIERKDAALPIDPVALEATLKTLRLTQVAVPTLWDEDTADELLHLVGTTYYNLVTAVLEDPLPSGQPGERVPLALLAALHGRAVAGLLTALAVADSDEAELSAPRAAELIEAAIDTITRREPGASVRQSGHDEGRAT